MSLDLAMSLKDQGKLSEAEAVLRKIVDASPDHAGSHNNLGIILYQQGKLKEAEASYRRALDINPNTVTALSNLGIILIDTDRLEESIMPFRRHAELVYGDYESKESPYYKIWHDKEQRDYLNGTVPKFHLDEGLRVSGRAINYDGEIETRWKNNSPKIAVIDNILSNEALDGLRRYCWRSTIWQKPYQNGYLGAFPEHGFACPLIVQIADELRSTYPTIISDPLIYWWGFKYDSKLRGIRIHADIAVVNVNLWITPDEANLDPESGGLVIWDIPTPSDWDFNKYNSGSEPVIREFLKKNDAKPVKVPYKANRVVIFDADLFHETDQINFKVGYLNRRINITMLYGKRGSVNAVDKV